ncbi:MAG: hypothetical protein JNM67_05905 [Bacteroidetes bacterium]|nr:hypothetical protein [Bacteroidota bacterium]
MTKKQAFLLQILCILIGILSVFCLLQNKINNNRKISKNKQDATYQFANVNEVSNQEGNIIVGNIYAPLGIAKITLNPDDKIEKSVIVTEKQAAINKSPITPYMTIQFMRSSKIDNDPCKLIGDVQPGMESLDINGYPSCYWKNRQDGNSAYSIINEENAVVFFISSNTSVSPGGYFTYSIDGSNMNPYFEYVVKSIQFK